MISSRLAAELVGVAARDCAELVRRVFRLYGVDLDRFQVSVERDAAAPDIVLSFGDDAAPSLPGPRFAVRDILIPGRIAAPRVSAEPMNAANPDREDVRYFLQYLFRKDEFLEGQWETIERTLRGEDSIVLLPTGGGKSIAFQLSALLRPGCCVVVDPILSLIEDQIDNLFKVGIDRCLEISSAVGRDTRNATAARMAHYLFIYVAPERFQIKEFRDELRALTVSVPISEVAIDEAHCVSEWGHDFRTSYLRLGQNAREYCASQGSTPPIVALTGTASSMVLKNMQLDLDIRDFNAVVTPKSFDRPELEFRAVRVKVGESIPTLVGLLEALPGKFGPLRHNFFRPNGRDTHSIIVFTSTINGSTGTENVARELRKRFPMKIGTYSGGAPKGASGNWASIKREIAHRFKHNDLQMLVATSAYGMGIDKPNVRATIHMGLPHSIEQFYQEAGRAGRDRERAICEIVFAYDGSSDRLLNPLASIAKIWDAIATKARNEQDDIYQALWFHTQTFSGAEKEKQQLSEIVHKLGRLQTGRAQYQIRYTNNDDANSKEKSLHRLSILGVVEDYEKDYSGRLFTVHLSQISQPAVLDNLCAYIFEYQPALSKAKRDDLQKQLSLPLDKFVIEAGGALVDFVYEHVEKARRRATFEMFEAARNAARSGILGNTVLRDQVLRHLQLSEFDEALDVIIKSAYGGLDVINEALNRVDTPMAADSLRGATARLLESYPDQPALLLLRGIAEALARSSNPDVVESSIAAALANVAAYGIDEKEMVADALASCINTVAGANEEACAHVAAAIAWGVMVKPDLPGVDLAWLILKAGIPPEVSAPLISLLAWNLLASVKHIREVYHDKQQL